MEAARGTGAVLDTYTALVCADMGLLKGVRTWFGTVAISQSTIDHIDRLIAKEATIPGQEAMSLRWLDGQFFRYVKDVDYAKNYAGALNAIKAEVLLHCEVVSVAMPDDVNEELASAMRKFGSDPFEAIYLAAERNVPLISDDLHYRSLAAICAKVRSGWIQAFLFAAVRRGDIASPEYAHHVVRLAHLRHHLVQFDAKFLIDLFESNPDPELVDFKVICRYFGGAAAAMWGHSLIATAFLRSQWNKRNRDPRLPLASSILLGSLLREREDWPLWLALVSLRSPRNVVDYIADWALGHFFPTEPIRQAFQYWSRAGIG